MGRNQSRFLFLRPKNSSSRRKGLHEFYKLLEQRYRLTAKVALVVPLNMTENSVQDDFTLYNEKWN